MREGYREPASVWVFAVLRLLVLADQQVFAGIAEGVERRGGDGGRGVAFVRVIVDVVIVVQAFGVEEASVVCW